MRRISDAIDHLHMMDMESRQKGFLQDLHPLSKLLVTVIFIALTVSFHKYDLQGVLLMGLYPITMTIIGDIPLGRFLRRMGILMLLVILIGILNPLFDRTPLLEISSFTVTGGMVSMLSLIIKGVYTISSGYILMVTTSMDDISRGLRMIHVPEVIVTVMMMIYRYIIVFLKEAERVTTAYALRAPSQKGINIRAWGPLIGQILLRSVDRAEMVYSSMQLRGYHGDCYLRLGKAARSSDYIFCLTLITILTLIRIYS